jgi:hypothetical protein
MIGLNQLIDPSALVRAALPLPGYLVAARIGEFEIESERPWPVVLF